MAIIRSRSKANTRASSCTNNDPAPGRRQRSAGRTSSAADSDVSGDSELTERGVEICQVGEDICALPYELFKLSDLKGILSLDTWNLSLTEEERERLCAYLPNLDEESYRETLRMLFAGDNFDFSSPITVFFDRLKGGLCHPQVVRYQECLKYLQRKGHYHYLREHHNNMVNSFLEMQNFWQNYPQADFEERIKLWKSWKPDKSKPLPLSSEKKLNSSRKRRSSSLSARRSKAVNLREPSESPDHTPDRVPPSITDPKRGLALKLGSKLKARVECSSKLTNNETQKQKKLNSKLFSKTAAKGSLKNIIDFELGQSEPQPFLGEDNTACRTVSVFALENGNAVSDKPAPKKRSGKKGSSFGAGRKRKSVKEISELEEKKVKEEMMGNAEGPYRERLLLAEPLMIEEVDMLCDTKVEEEMQDFDEQIQEPPLAFQENHKNGKPKKKCRRRAKVRENMVNENDQEVIAVKLEQDEKGQASVSYGIAEDNSSIVKETNQEAVAGDEPSSEKPGKKGVKKRLKVEANGSVPSTSSPDGSLVLEKAASAKLSKKQVPLTVPSIVLSFPFSIIHLLSAVRTAMIPSDDQAFNSTCLGGETGVREAATDSATFMMSPEVHYFEPNAVSLQCNGILEIKDPEEEKKGGLPSIPFLEIVRRVKENPGDSRILETQEPLQGLVRGVLKVLSSKMTSPGIKGWKPFVFYDRENRAWSWIGPLPPPPLAHDMKSVQMSAEAWGVSEKIVIKIQELFANWLRQAQETLQKLGQLALPPLPPAPVPVDEKERFRELRAQKSLITINPTSDERKAYFHREEALRYSVPDRAFTYTRSDGRKSVVAPLRRIGSKPNSKARDHFMLQPDRPSHVTILCLVRDAAARLPGSIGTRADVCALIRDSQYIVEDVSDAQLNQVVSGALDRLHYERDPCVRFDGDKKLWVYLHTDRDEEDFEDDGTSSTKRWKKSKKEAVEHENADFPMAQEYGYSVGDEQDPCGIGLDFSSPSCFGGPGDLSVYSSGRPELVYNLQNGSLVSPHMLGSGFVREDGMLSFIDLPPSIQPPCVNMQQSHPMGWEVLGNRWIQEPNYHFHDHIIQEDYNPVTAPGVVHREIGTMIERGLH